MSLGHVLLLAQLLCCAAAMDNIVREVDWKRT